MAQRQLSWFAITVVAVATPATVALSVAKLTGDPTLRPFATTIDYLRAPTPPADSDTIRVRIDWPGQATEDAAYALAATVSRSIAAKGLPAEIRIRGGFEAPLPMLTFAAGVNEFGPFGAPAAAYGVQAAAMALRMRLPATPPSD